MKKGIIIFLIIFNLLNVLNSKILATEIENTDKSIFKISIGYGYSACLLELYESGLFKFTSGKKETPIRDFEFIKGYEIPVWNKVNHSVNLKIENKDVEEFKELARAAYNVDIPDDSYRPYLGDLCFDIAMEIDDKVMIAYDDVWEDDPRIRALFRKAFDTFDVTQEPYNFPIPNFIIFYDKPLREWASNSYRQRYKGFDGKYYIKYNIDRKFLYYEEIKLTKGELIGVLGRAAGADIKNYQQSRFKDVSKGMYYWAYIEWAVDNKIVPEVKSGNFNPKAYITNEEACVIVYNFINYLGLEIPSIKETTKYLDDQSISVWAKHAVYSLKSGNMLSSKETLFRPKSQDTIKTVSNVLYYIVDQMCTMKIIENIE